MGRYITKRLLSSILVLIGIVYLSLFVQEMAGETSGGGSASVATVAVDAARDMVQVGKHLVTGDLGMYYGNRGYGSRATEELGVALQRIFKNSAVLLLVAMAVGGFVGVIIGAIAAASKRKGVSALVLLVSVIGISTPSFFLAMILQILEITWYKRTGIRLVPVGGFGWDNHMILPVLVLAARPVAQVARLSYVAVSNILEQDYVRTARAKGLSTFLVWTWHVLRNAVGTILITLATSLRLALSSLPVVETVFSWPGAGVGLLYMLQSGQGLGASLLVLILGGSFILINLIVDILQRVVDPRLSEEAAQVRFKSSWTDGLSQALRSLWVWATLARWREDRKAEKKALGSLKDVRGVEERRDDVDRRADRVMARARRDAWIRATAGNPSLVFGLLMTAMLLFVVLAGSSLSPHDPFAYQVYVDVDGQSVVPPIAPNDVYPLGTDGQGRDVLSLLLTGASRTLTIALFSVLGRMVVGCILGFVAGWYSGSRLDRLITGVGEAFSAFPGLLLAMLIVFGLGVREGMSSFVIALAVVGWADVMQAVRSEVAAIRPMAYVEGAVANGLTEAQILSAHVLPNVWPKIVSLAFLEMGGVLMLLGELGFLGVFIGGGRAASGDAAPVLIYYDVPEWSVMLANSWRSARSAPWAALYPAGAFFAAILGFTYLGEGLRQVSEKLTLSLRTLFNRYTLLVGVVVVGGLYWAFDANSYAAIYAPVAAAFSEERAMEDIDWLTDPALGGRLSGSAEAESVAEAIKAEFLEYGLQPGGESNTYYQSITAYYNDFAGAPTLLISGPNGEQISGVYGVDFVQETASPSAGGSGGGELVLMAPGNVQVFSRDGTDEAYGVSDQEVDRHSKVVFWAGDRFAYGTGLNYVNKAAVLAIGTDEDMNQLFRLPVSSARSADESVPSVLVTGGFMQNVLLQMGYDLDTLRGSEFSMYVNTGWQIDITVPIAESGRIEVRNVIGIWPGEDVVLDNDAVIISAYYDGLGHDELGELMPGANDNASGVATMLEVLRTLEEQDFLPQRTLIFVAWTGAERGTAVNYERFMEAHLGFDRFNILAAIELEGVGAGSGDEVLMTSVTRNTLAEIVQKASKKTDTPLVASGMALHDAFGDWPGPSMDVPSMTLTWDGAGQFAHSPQDTYETIDPEKIGAVGRLTALSVMMMTTDPSY